MTHDGFGLDVQVSEHLVRLPAAQESNTVRIHVSAEEGHGASGAEGPGRDILGAETVGGPQDVYRGAEHVGELGRSDPVKDKGESGINIGGERLVRGGGRVAEVKDAASGREDGAKLWVATAAQSNDFTPDTTFLCGELQRHKRGGEEVWRWRGCGGQWQAPKEKSDVTQLEGLCRGDGASILAWPEEEEEGKANHVGAGQGVRGRG